MITSAAHNHSQIDCRSPRPSSDANRLVVPPVTSKRIIVGSTTSSAMSSITSDEADARGTFSTVLMSE